MARDVKKKILDRQLKLRSQLWSGIKDTDLWSMNNDGWVAVPRLMPLFMNIMDYLSEKGYPVGKTYFELWCRLRIEESFLQLTGQEEMAFYAGFEGQRALRTWKDRIKRLIDLGFIYAVAGPSGDYSYIIFLNPYHVIKRAYIAGKLPDKYWHSLISRSSEIRAIDLDQIDDKNGEFISKTKKPVLATAAPVPPVFTAAPVPPVSTAAPVPPVSTAAPVPPVFTAAPVPPVSTAAPVPPVSTAAPVPPVSKK